MPKLKHYNDPCSVRFITFACYHHLSLLHSDFAKKCFLTHLEKNRVKFGYKLLAYVVMPNHVHLLLQTPEKLNLGRAMGDLKSRTATEILANLKLINSQILKKLIVKRDGRMKYAFWQRRCYDHNCRDRESVIEKINYCHNNPVKKGLAVAAGDYSWSSCGWYEGKVDNIITPDGFAS